MTTQSTLADLQGGESGTEIETEESDAKETTNKTTGATEFKETLKDIGISRPARIKLTEKYNSVDDLTSSSDVDIQSIDEVGEKTIETIRQELDENVGEDYKITDSGEGYCKAEWTEKADEDEDILTGEILLRDFISDEFGHQATFLKALTSWASTHNGSSEAVAQDLITAAYSLDPEEAHMHNLFDETQEFDSEEEREEAKQEAILKARAVMAFADISGHRDMYLAAAQEARKKIEAEAEAKREEEQKQKEGERFLRFPDDEIGGWQRIKYGLANIPSVIKAYRGTYRNSPSIVALYDTGEYIKVKGFRHMDWVEADQDPLETKPCFSTASMPETKVEGAIAMKEWLSNNPSGEVESPSKLKFNGWYVTEYIEDEKLVYEEPDQPARIIADGNNVTLKAGGEQQTVEEKSHHRACKTLRNYIYANPAISEGGDQIEVPFPEEELTDSKNRDPPLEALEATQEVDIDGMELENGAEGWGTFPHPDDIESHLDEDLSTDQVLPQEVRETVDKLKEDPNVGDFLIFGAEEAYEYLEQLQKNSDLHLENFHRSQLLVDQMAHNATLSSFDKEWICEWECRRRLAEREFDSWGQANSHQLSKKNKGLPNNEDVE